MTTSRIALAALFTVALTSYAQATTIYDQDNSSQFYPGFVQDALASGMMAVDIYGLPFAQHSKNEAANIASELQVPPSYGNAHFTTTPKANMAGQRLVMIFNPKADADGTLACTNPQALEGGASTGSMRVEMALCNDKDWVSQTMVSGPKGSGISDRQFRKTLQDGLAELMPNTNPNPHHHDLAG
jgi:hypothetical protein